MLNYIVKGGNRLEGSTYIRIKNAALPIIAATILNSRISKLCNVSRFYPED